MSTSAKLAVTSRDVSSYPQITVIPVIAVQVGIALSLMSNEEVANINGLLASVAVRVIVRLQPVNRETSVLGLAVTVKVGFVNESHVGNEELVNV